MGPVPGMILGRSEDSLIVSTGEGNLSVSALSIEGESGSAMAPALWAVGMVPGTFFDPSPTATRSS